jgi:hypothetical protein
MSVCANCLYFNASAFPGNAKFGVCVYALPALPAWLHPTPEQYRAVSIGTRDCETWKAAKPGDEH